MAGLSARLDGRGVIVTGPAKGMGPAICRALAEAGASLVLAARDTDAAEALAAELPGARVERCDLVDEASVAAAVLAAERLFGEALWGAVCVAGGAGPSGRKLWEHTTGDFRELFDVNVQGPFLVMKHLLPLLMARGRGSVVTIGGTYGFKGVRDACLYGASKWALRGLTKSAALEAGCAGVRVNMVSPGAVEGPRVRRQFGEAADRLGVGYDEVVRRFLAGTALGRMSEDQDVAAAVLFLLSDMARNVTGQDLLVDGGTIV